MANQTVVRPPFYVPRPSDTSENQWIGRPIASALLAVLLVAGGQPHTKQWHYDYDVGESVWQGKPTANALLLTPAAAATITRAAITVPTYDDSSLWQGQPTASALLHPLLTNVGQAQTKRWDYQYDEGGLWQGAPRASALLHPLLTASGQVPTKQWEWHSDDSSVWTGKPTASALLAPLLTSVGKANTKRWDYQYDEGGLWQGQPTPSTLLHPLLTNLGKVNTKQWHYDYDEGGLWWPTPPRNLATLAGIKAQQAFPYTWRFNVDDPPPWQIAVNRNITLLQPAAAGTLLRAAMFVPTYYDDGPWWDPFTSALVEIPGQVQTPLWRWDFDESPPWALTIQRNLALLQPAGGVVFVPRATFNVPAYNTAEIHWVGQPIPSLSARLPVSANPVFPHRWAFNYDDSAPWQFGFQPHLELLTAVLQPEVSQPPWNWDYTYEETVPWQFRYPLNVSLLTQTPKPVVSVQWRWGYDDGAHWTGQPVAGLILNKLLNTGSVVAKLWTWDYAETGAWNAQPIAGTILNKLLNTGPVPPLRPFGAIYSVIDEAFWMGRPTSNVTLYEVFIPPPPTTEHHDMPFFATFGQLKSW
jgi:hypothetical protein